MKIGTKSILFGAHCFFIHPIFVCLAWWRLYGFSFDPRLYIAFFVHDLGYWGKKNMDGADGKTHVEFGANLMRVFGDKWYKLTKYHSRYYAAIDGVSPSMLCVADKLSLCIEPKWLYLFRVNLTGEVYEYMKENNVKDKDKLKWLNYMRTKLSTWVWANAYEIRYLK